LYLTKTKTLDLKLTRPLFRQEALKWRPAVFRLTVE